MQPAPDVPSQARPNTNPVDLPDWGPALAIERLARSSLYGPKPSEVILSFSNIRYLSELHPGLKTILEAELALGNQVRDVERGWPESGGMVIRLAHPFAARFDPLPDGVVKRAVNDPHWWMTEYEANSPRQFLVS